MILQLPRMAPHVLRHLGALARLGTQDAKQAAAAYGRVATRLAVAGTCAFFALLMACAWALALAWDTEYRTWVAAGLALAFGGVALWMLGAARGDAARQAAFAATKRNLELDRKLYAELRPEQAAQPSAPPEQQLARSREEIRRVAQRSEIAGHALRFPRSRTMQVLTRGGPAGSAALAAWLMQRRQRHQRRT